MVEWTRWFLPGLPLFVLTAICTHLVVSSSQTLFHYGLGHHRIPRTFSQMGRRLDGQETVAMTVSVASADGCRTARRGRRKTDWMAVRNGTNT
jgi:hypothetical protein